MKNTLIVLVVLVIIGGGIYWFFVRGDSAAPTSNTSNTNSTKQTELTSLTTIILTDNGFSPSSYTSKSGNSVTIQNNSSSTLGFYSDNHPTHTKNTELNVGNIEPGESKTVVLTNIGTWGFHNHLNSSETGSITVK